MSDELASLNGKISSVAEATIPVTDEGFLRGDGAFEVVRIYDGRPFAMDDHMQRMANSAALLRLEDFPRESIEREATELLEQRGGGSFDGCLRIVVTRGGRRLLLTEPLPQTPERLRLAVVTYAPTRVLDGIKSLSYAANMLCGRIARERGFDEALLVTPHGRVLEAPTSSFFWADAGGRLFTPPLDEHILASITRQKILDLLDVEECSLTVDELPDVHEAFLASTTREAQPIAAIEGRELPGAGELTQQAATAFAAHVAQEFAGR